MKILGFWRGQESLIYHCHCFSKKKIAQNKSLKNLKWIAYTPHLVFIAVALFSYLFSPPFIIRNWTCLPWIFAYYPSKPHHYRNKRADTITGIEKKQYHKCKISLPWDHVLECDSLSETRKHEWGSKRDEHNLHCPKIIINMSIHSLVNVIEHGYCIYLWPCLQIF